MAGNVIDRKPRLTTIQTRLIAEKSPLTRPVGKPPKIYHPVKNRSPIGSKVILNSITPPAASGKNFRLYQVSTPSALAPELSTISLPIPNNAPTATKTGNSIGIISTNIIPMNAGEAISNKGPNAMKNWVRGPIPPENMKIGMKTIAAPIMKVIPVTIKTPIKPNMNVIMFFAANLKLIIKSSARTSKVAFFTIFSHPE